MLNWLGLSSDKLYLYPMNHCNSSLGCRKIILKINNLIKFHKKLSKSGKANVIPTKERIYRLSLPVLYSFSNRSLR